MTAIKHGFGSALAYIDGNLNLLTPPQVVIGNDSETRYITQVYTSFTVRDQTFNFISRYALLRIRLTRNLESLITYSTPLQFELIREEDDVIFLAIIKANDYIIPYVQSPHHIYHFDPPLTVPKGKAALISLNHFTDVVIPGPHQIWGYVSVHGYTQQDKIQELQELR
jgi:hypothetical protein